jgi:hypothetical protein
MPNDLTDLLPSERHRALARDYLLRLGVVAVWFATALVLASALLLAPTYVFLAQSSRAKEARLANIESALSLSDGTALAARLSALTSNTDALAALAHAPSASATIRSALAIARPGITFSGFAYTPADGTRPGTLAISGTATTRDALRRYQLVLQDAPFARSASLPVSTYAKDSNIAFTVTVTLAP